MLKSFTRFSTVLLVLVLTSTYIHAQLDPAFGTNGKTLYPVTRFGSLIDSFLLADGRFLVLKTEQVTVSSPKTYSFIRFNSDGTLDTTYGTNGSVELAIPFISTSELDRGLTSATRQADGKVVMVGFDNGNGLVIRFNENGSLDTSFSGDGVHRPNINQTDSDTVDRAIYQHDGKLVVVGRSAQNNVTRIFLIRYEANGDLDLGFGDQAGFIIHPLRETAVGFARQSNGGYIALGLGYNDVFILKARVYRFNVNGSLDNSFSSPLFASDEASTLLIDSNDRVVVGGSPYRSDHLFRNQSDLELTRLNSGGGLDATFGNSGSLWIDVAGGTYDTLGDLLELPDGSIVIAATTVVDKNRSPVVGGQMSVLTVSGTGQVIGRYLATSGGGSNLLRQPDGKLVITGIVGDAATSSLLLTRHVGVPLMTYRFHGIPFEFTNFGSGPLGVSEPAVFRPSTGRWYAPQFLFSGIQFGIPTDIPAAGDFFSGFQAELAVFRPSNGTWYISKGYSSTDFVTVQWGANGDVPAAYDYDGDGKYDVTVFRPSDGNWYIRQSSDSGVQIHCWGVSGDTPVVGDYDGDGLGDLAIWRPSTGVWYIHRSSDGQAQVAQFGLNGDIPIQEDYDGDLITDIGVFRPSTGVWYIWRSSDGGFTIVGYGLNGDVPTPADYDGDRKTDIGIFRPSTSVWYRIDSSSGSTEQFTWGVVGDIAVEGRY